MFKLLDAINKILKKLDINVKYEDRPLNMDDLKIKKKKKK